MLSIFLILSEQNLKREKLKKKTNKIKKQKQVE